MPELHPQFVTDPNGKRLSVLLPIAEYEALMSYLEGIEDTSAAVEALRKIESGEDSVIGLDELLRNDVTR